MSAMGKMYFFLGLQVKESYEGIFIHQEKYIYDIVTRLQITNASALTTPIDVKENMETKSSMKM